MERDLADARRRARGAWDRWRRTQDKADEYAALVLSGPTVLRAANAQRADALQRAAEVHRSTARLQDRFVARLEDALEAGRADETPHFIAEVAALVDTTSAAVTVQGTAAFPAVGVASDALAGRWQDAELMTGQGPTLDAVTTGALVWAPYGELCQRWPHLADVVGAWGVRSVASAPMRHPLGRIGALTLVNPGPPMGKKTLASVQAVADGLAETVLEELDKVDEGTSRTLRPPLLRDDRLDPIHQATGRVAHAIGCDPSAALDLIRARAFSESIDLSVLVDDIVAGRFRFDD